jgi:6-phosphofructokinase 1
MSAEGRAQAAENIERSGVEGLVVIGGDGSFRGAHLLHEEHGVPVIGVPGTIDNDIYGTDATIGYNTALGIALDAIDRLRDTAESHDRLFLVEVMGRHAGHIALNVGLAGGAEAILLPEVAHDVDEVISAIARAQARGKTSSIIVVAEGAYEIDTIELQKRLEAACGVDVRTSILGHMQRGGSPTTCDRVLASRLGHAAVHGLLAGKEDVMVGVQNNKTAFVPLKDTWEKQKGIDWELFEIAKVLAV